MSLDALHMKISSGMVVAARHWRRLCQGALTGYGISEACAVPLLMIVRLGDGVHQVAVAQAAGLEARRWCACSTSCARRAWCAAARTRWTAAPRP
jgi:triphosphoribosyl-dephospho-CoA synthetase